MRIVIALLSCLLTLSAQELKLERAGAGDVLLGDRIDLVVALAADPAAVVPGALPDAPGWVLQPGAISAAGGGASWRLGARAVRTGTLKVPSLMLEIAGVRRRTNALTLEVVEPPAAASDVRLTWHQPAEPFEIGIARNLELVVDLPAAFRAEQLVPLFRRNLEFPVVIDGEPLADALRDAATIEAARSEAAGDSLALAGRVARLTEWTDEEGRSRARVVVARITPQRAGRLELPRFWLDHAFATRWRDSFATGRVPLDRVTARAVTPATSIEVVDPSRTAVPEGYEGPVGRFRLEVSWDEPEVALGSFVVMRLRVSGEGRIGPLSWADFGAPTPAGLRFEDEELAHAEPDASSRMLVVRFLAVKAGEVEAAPLSWAFFDDGPDGGSRTATASVATLAVTDSSDLTLWFVIGGLLVVFAGFVASRGRGGAATAEEQGPRPLEVLEEALSVETTDSRTAFFEHLEAVTGLSRAAIDDPALGDRLVGLGVERGVALDCADAVRALTAASYGGQGISNDDLLALARRLDIGLPQGPAA